MAIQKVKKDLSSILNSIDHEFIRRESGLNDFHVIKITAEETAVALQKGTQKMLLAAGFSQKDVTQLNQQINTKSSWQNVIAKLYSQFRSGPKVVINGVPVIKITRIQDTPKI